MRLYVSGVCANVVGHVNVDVEGARGRFVIEIRCRIEYELSVITERKLMPYRFHGSSFFFRVRKIDGRKGRNPNARNLNAIINIHGGNLMEFLIRK